MHHTTRRRATTSLLLTVVATALLAAPAAAHVTANPSSTAAGGYAIVDVRVPHGCDGQATAVLEVQIPEGVTGVKPEDVPGWTATTETVTYDEPVELHGEAVTEGVGVVTWTADEGEELADEQFRDFGLSVRFPDAAGRTLTFPAIQTCVDGSESTWLETSDDPDAELDTPAPTITLTAADGGEHEDDASGADAAGEAVGGAQDAEVTATPAATADEGTEPLVIVALVAGVLGLLLGAVGLRAARSSR